MEIQDPNNVPPLTWPSWAGERVFVVGLGGGADIISAYALGESLQPRPQELVYGNTKTQTEPDWMRLSTHLARLPIEATQRASRGTAIDRLLPRGLRGDPIICQLEKGGEAALAEEIKALGCSVILGVDTGGDVLSRKKGAPGRDQRMLAVLEQVGLPLWLFVLAPGIDGQSSAAQLAGDLLAATMDERFRGVFSLAPLLGVYQRYAASLGETRTPRLVLQAFATQEETMLVPRGCRPTLATAWLRLGMALSIR